MDVITRALLDLRTLDVSRSEAETRYLEFKNRAHTYLVEATGSEAQADTLLAEFFHSFLPSVLRAAAGHEDFSNVACDDQRALIDEVMADKQGILAHSPILYPLNRMCMDSVKHARPALDLGIGNGRSSAFCLAGRDIDVGGDVIPSNLVKAKARRSHREFYALDMAALPFEPGSFRNVYALNCIYHVQGGRGTALAEMVRVLAPGGTLALTDVSPYLNELKPLESFLKTLEFDDLADDFTSYFLSGYGADGSAGDPAWYRKALEGLGMVDIEVSYLMSPRLTKLGYLLYDWQALFNFDGQRKLEGSDGEKRYKASYRPMLMSLIAPLLKLDAQHCKEAGKGGYVFVTARKAGSPPQQVSHKLSCPACRVPLSPEFSCSSCGRDYPSAKGVPLLTTFFADAAAK